MSVPPEDMSEGELLAAASKAMLKAASLAPGSLERSVQWAVYDQYAAELRRRAITLVHDISTRGKP